MDTNYLYEPGTVVVEVSGATVLDGTGTGVVPFGSVVEVAGIVVVVVVVVVDCIHRRDAHPFSCVTINEARVLYPDTVR
jgi:hypothetical protein